MNKPEECNECSAWIDEYGCVYDSCPYNEKNWEEYRGLNKIINKIDREIEEQVNFINGLVGLRTVASCSGHNVYHKTIFYINEKGEYWEYYSKLQIQPIKRKSLCFYVFDKKARLYYNPQVETYWQEILEVYNE